jgi:2-keto-4-pentenoate hydratase/2-oxohepta-3-ene-1,7-dioic acid hydratase in catechol pathway
VKILSFEYKNKISWGVLENVFVRPLKGAPFKKIAPEKDKIRYEQVKVLAPAAPSKIILVGLNYRDHALEMGMPVPKEPIIFLKPATAIIAHKDNIVYPAGTQRVDYEGELALVIKEEAKNIPEEKAAGYILGYTCLNDVTARDLQKKDAQWTRAKSFDTFCPLGPWLETCLDPCAVGIRTHVNGRMVQNSNTSNFIFSVNYLVSFISHIMTLLPGDVISTGTPPGVGALRPGDKVEVEIEGIGTLTNGVRGKKYGKK